MPVRTAHKGWYSRGYLPHLDTPELFQAVTFRLKDSLPAAVTEATEPAFPTPETVFDARSPRRQAVEDALDAGYGSCILGDPRAAAVMRDALLAFQGTRYRLTEWVVMPNHVHALLQPQPGHGLPGILHSWKSYTAKRINGLMGRTGPLWQREYFDRYVRDETHYETVAAYIRSNPVKAGLVERAEDWPFGSAAVRAEMDG